MTPDSDRTGGEGARSDTLFGASRETWAWALRAEAEWLRLRVAGSAPDAPDPMAHVAAWRDAVAAFEQYGHASRRPGREPGSPPRCAGPETRSALAGRRRLPVRSRRGSVRSHCSASSMRWTRQPAPRHTTPRS